MADWWKTTGWPWLKKNWWAVLLAPLALLIFVLMFFMRGRQGVVLDPLAEANERAEEERRLRERGLQKERDDLAKRVQELEAEHEAQQEHIENRVREEVQALREDPEKLRELMLRVGPGRPR